ncbi:50S ribosomal protein L18 [Hibiscus syriacus]|uniref:50S ribosomal protein L18 n=1 Tax=Hibiscus syriacus TaxID=106335 RepID=A0A6A3BWH7_HIBSY|nr:(R)-mandelonitrile lyase-like [Hibiscus syriacus]KAE8719788.1 50S ribosomal protein L18 [Hibiscus syriacus]
MEALNIKMGKRIRHDRLLKAFIFFFVDLSLCSPSITQGELPFMTSDVKEVAGKSFDYIVVGGGTAGCPLAATLSEKFSVLLIERGGSPYGNPLVMEKRFYGYSLIQTDEFSSVAQDFTSTDGVRNSRGRVLGGSSAINGGFYSRASEDFIDKAGWDKESVKDAYTWVESKIVSKPELTPWQTVVEFGLVEAGFLPYNGYSLEHVEGTKIGGSIFDVWGIRHTSADLLKAANPKNVVVLLNMTVKNIVFKSNGNASETTVKGVRFIKSDGSRDQTYKAYLNQPKNCTSKRGDVILSAGALSSPQILLLSGVGHRKQIENFDIPHVKNLKGIGKKMKDNPSIAVLVDTNPQSRQPEPPQVSGIAKDFKFIIEGGVIPTSFNATRMPIAAKIAFPVSEGELKLSSSDPRQTPAVKFNYLDDEKDLDACADMVHLLERVARSHSVAFYLGAKPQNNLMTSTDEQRKFCKENVRTYFHYHGGCTVGSVVDNDYKVYGVKGLRVVDGSTFRESPGTNPMATLMMLGRYQGLKILREREHVSSLSTQQNP